MSNNDVSRLGSVCAFVLAALYLVATVVLQVSAGPPDETPDDVFARLADPSVLTYLYWWSAALIPVFLIPVVTSIDDLLRRASPALVRWATIMGLIGCAGTILHRFRPITLLPIRAQMYLEGDEMTKAAITALEYDMIDPGYWLQFGFVGFWFLVISIVALREGRTFSRGWAYLGLIGAVINLAMPLAMHGLPAIGGPLTVLGGVIVAPIWAIWTGRRLGSLARSGSAGDRASERMPA